MQEIWKDIPGYEGHYQVSDHGRVKSLSRRVGCNGGSKILPEIVMSQKTDKDGYKAVSLHKDLKDKHLRVHRLVLMAFEGMPTDGKCTGMHLDDNPANNFLNNLKWGSDSENMRQAFDKGRKVAHKPWLGKSGSDNPHSKKIVQMDMNYNEINTFTGIYEAHRQTKINRSCISACCLGNRSSSGGYKWKYAS